MADQPDFGRVAIIGVGLIGGSFGMALRARSLAGQVVGIGRNADRLRLAAELGAVDSWTLDVEEGVRGADLVYIATPVGSIVDFAEKALPFVNPGCVMTDAGSTKGEICRRVDELVEDRAAFVGGHPMAGSESAGVESARADLFESSTYVLTPTLATKPEAVARLRSLAGGIGARVIVMEPDEHDRCAAVISHLPHIMAAALALLAQQESACSPHLFDLAAGSFRDMTRVAGSSPILWRDICLSNVNAVSDAARSLASVMERAVEIMQSGDPSSLEDWFADAKSVRDTFYPPRENG
jgi:prephenate dehydrogenase